jgi:chromosome segregation ATPase
MWPKALTQLVELAPHITRLAPLADRFFKEKATGDEVTRQALERQRLAFEAQRAAITDMGDRLRADLAAVASAQASQTTQVAEAARQSAALSRQLTDLEKHLSTTRADALAAKSATESLEARLGRIETTGRRVQGLAAVALVLLAALLVFMATLFLRAH